MKRVIGFFKKVLITNPSSFQAITKECVEYYELVLLDKGLKTSSLMYVYIVFVLS